VSAILGSTEAEWKEVFDQAGKSYQPPTLVMFSGATQSGCGFARSAMGPFYCPVDQKVYLDTSFFQDLERRFRGCDVGSKTCQFSQAYVIAHEIGHHVQNLLGILPKVQQAKEGVEQADANALQVRVESNSLSLAMSKLPCRPLQQLATIDCSGRAKVTSYQTRSPMVLRRNALAGSLLD